jgi:hypothetical protein
MIARPSRRALRGVRSRKALHDAHHDLCFYKTAPHPAQNSSEPPLNSTPYRWSRFPRQRRLVGPGDFAGCSSTSTTSPRPVSSPMTMSPERQRHISALNCWEEEPLATPWRTRNPLGSWRSHYPRTARVHFPGPSHAFIVLTARIWLNLFRPGHAWSLAGAATRNHVAAARSHPTLPTKAPTARPS